MPSQGEPIVLVVVLVAAVVSSACSTPAAERDALDPPARAGDIVLSPSPRPERAQDADREQALRQGRAEGVARGLELGFHHYRPGTATRVSLQRCRDRVSSRLEHGWRDEALVVGPLAFTHAPHYADPGRDDVVANEEGKYPALKNLAVLDAGSIAVVVVPDEHRQSLALLYPGLGVIDSDGFAALEDAERAVVFLACPGNRTQFAGSLLATKASCAHLDVWIDDAEEPERMPLSFGAGDCP
jgi:hypothetical protein